MRWILPLLLLVACTRRGPERVPEDLLKSFEEQFGEKYQLQLVKKQVGRERLILRFEGDHHWKLEEIRRVIRDGVGTLLANIETAGKKDGDRYLREFPIDDLDFTISLNIQDSVHVSNAYLLDGTIYYAVWDPGLKRLKRVTQERYNLP